jgi:hypothetical protein
MITDPALLARQAGDLLEHAADRRAGGQALQASRKERMDEYGAAASRMALPRRNAAGKFNDEIVPMTVTMGVADKATGQLLTKQVTIAADEGIRPTPRSKAVQDPQRHARRRHHRRQCQPVPMGPRAPAW